MEQTIVRIYDRRYKSDVKSRAVSNWGGSYQSNDVRNFIIFC